MRSIACLVAVMSVLYMPSTAFGAAKTPDVKSGPSSSQMLQCNSPDPSRAIIGCTAIIQSSGIADLKSAAYSTRGLAYQKRGENDRAIADLDQAIAILPKSANAFRSRGDFYQ